MRKIQIGQMQFMVDLESAGGKNALKSTLLQEVCLGEILAKA